MFGFTSMKTRRTMQSFEALRGRGVDVLTIFEAHMESATDEEQLVFATSRGRCIYSLNVQDFCRLHSEFIAGGQEHSGIIVIPRQRYGIGEKVRRLAALVNSVTAEQMRNRLEFV